MLRGLSLTISAGSRTALVGPSGAGKTTLLRAISGLAPIETGTILLGGEPIHHRAVHRRAIAVVFQEPRLLPHLDVQDNVARAPCVRTRAYCCSTSLWPRSTPTAGRSCAG